MPKMSDIVVALILNYREDFDILAFKTLLTMEPPQFYGFKTA
jgi:hypothetical protein